MRNNPTEAYCAATTDAAAKVRVALRAPAWSAVGYSADAHGCVFWYHAQNRVPCVRYGTHMASGLEAELKESCEPMPRAVRYARRVVFRIISIFSLFL